MDAAQRLENVNNIRRAGVGCEKQSANGAGETCEIAPRLTRRGAFLTYKKKKAAHVVQAGQLTSEQSRVPEPRRGTDLNHALTVHETKRDWRATFGEKWA